MISFLTLAGPAGFRCVAQDPPVEGRFRELTGEVRIETADATRDVDGDGLPEVEEYRAGTNPASALSRFGMEGVERVPGGLRLAWSAAPGHRVILERAARMDATAWEPVGTPVLMQGDRAARVVPVVENGEGFFRLRRP